MAPSGLSGFVNRTKRILSRESHQGGQTVEQHPQGLEVVSEGNNPIVDIVALHGLNGHREKTWTADNGVHWLRDLLPEDIPQARILYWGYDANTHASDRVSWQYLYDHARNLVSDLCRKRKMTNSTEQPIIFVAHSLGGIVLKSALIHSDAARQGALAEHRAIKLSTHRILFIGTPHQGGNGVRLGRVLANVASLIVAADERLLKHLKRDSEWLQQQLGQYTPISNNFVTKFAYEEWYRDPQRSFQDMQTPSRLQSTQITHPWFDMHQGKMPAGRDVNSFTLPVSLPGVAEVRQFVAREEELAQIHQYLSVSPGRQTVVVHGLGGMGKTQLAIAYVKRHRNDYSATIWLNVRDEASLNQSFRIAATRISREYPTLNYLQTAVLDKDYDAWPAVKRWLEEPKNDRWLLIYDNYDHPSMGVCARAMPVSDDYNPDQHSAVDEQAPEAYDIRQYLPKIDQGMVIVTTRSSIVQIEETLRLQKFCNEEDGLRILETTSSRKGCQEADPYAIALARELDGLPLALSTAGAYLTQVSTSWQQYLQDYKTAWAQLQKLSPPLLTYENRALYSTWNISYASIRQRNESAAMLLRLWAFFGNEDLWYELVRRGRTENGPQWLWDLTETRLAFEYGMRELCNHGLVEAHFTVSQCGTESSGYGVHSCVHSWMVHVLNGPNEMKLPALAMKCISLHKPKQMIPECWIVQRRLMLHADRCRQLLSKAGDDESNAEVSASLGTLYADQGRPKEAGAMYSRALQGYEKAWGPEHMSTLLTIQNIGNLYKDQKRFEEAEAMYSQALQGLEKTYGPEHSSTLITVHNLGSLYVGQERYEEAEAMYNRALQGKKKAWGPEHMSTLMTTQHLGHLYKDQKRFEEAEAMYSQALQGLEKTCGPEHGSTLISVHNLGNLYKDQKRFKEAEAMYDWALKGYEKKWAPEHTATLDSVKNLAILYGRQGRLDEAKAKAMYNRALQGYQKMLSNERKHVLEAVKNLGHLYIEVGQETRAKELFIEAFASIQVHFGDDSGQAQYLKQLLANWTLE
ncbi:hypothetical protein K4F52_009552 [Lecanicillium sp. MT-2017a]|nr:hypothetical protein K4F52_009552 [Lecanicillium sp. MT-2017a]